jgi:hypothetical protein
MIKIICGIKGKKNMSICEQIKANILILIILVFFILISGGPTGLARALAVEMPPVPGQVYHQSPEPGQEPEDVESLPPAVQKMDELIKQETKVLQRGFNTPELEPDAESMAEPDPEPKPEQSYETTPDSSPSTPEAEAKSVTEQPVAEDETNMPLQKETQSDSYTPSEVNEAEVAEEDKSPKPCAIGVATSGKIGDIGFFLKGLIIFTMVGITGFAILRKFFVNPKT